MVLVCLVVLVGLALLVFVGSRGPQRLHNATAAPAGGGTLDPIPPADLVVIDAFGAFLEARGEQDREEVLAAHRLGDTDKLLALGPRIRSESELPHPVARIRQALETALERVDDADFAERFRVGLVLLREYVPDGQVPTDPEANRREFQRLMQEPLPARRTLSR